MSLPRLQLLLHPLTSSLRLTVGLEKILVPFLPAFMRQGVPQQLIQDVETISSNPRRFETGGA